MLSYVESGIIKHLLTKDLPEAVICPLNLGSKERQLRSSDLFTTYAIIIAGFLFASVVFCIEIIQNLCKRRRMKMKWKKNKISHKLHNFDKFQNNSIATILNEGSFSYINGRDYVNVTNVDDTLKFIPARGLSALLFHK